MCGDSWEDGRNVDDVGFLREVLYRVQATNAVDSSRIYWAGHSNGCAMAQSMADVASDIVTAVGCAALFKVPRDYAKMKTQRVA